MMSRPYLAALALALGGCADLIELNNVAADNELWLRRNPEAEEALKLAAVPGDDRFHVHANVAQVSDKNGATGWLFTLSARHSIPFVLRPPYPPKTYPPAN